MQIGWILTRIRHGGIVFIAVRRRNKTDDELWLIHGKAIRLLTNSSLNELPNSSIAGQWAGGPANWDWDNVLTILINSRN